MTASGAAAHVAANGATAVAFAKVPAHGADRQQSETRSVDGTHSSGTQSWLQRSRLEIRARYVPERLGGLLTCLVVAGWHRRTSGRTKRVGCCGARLSVEHLCICLQPFQNQAVGCPECGLGCAQDEQQVRDRLVRRCGCRRSKTHYIDACACAGGCRAYPSDKCQQQSWNASMAQASWLRSTDSAYGLHIRKV